MESNENQREEGFEPVSFLYRKRKIVLGCLLFALVAAGIVTFITPKRYASFGIVFPVYNNNIESVVDNPSFGYDVEADRMIQLLESDEVRDSVTQKFDLINYYKINNSDPDWRDQLRERFVKDITFVRTPYMSIIISAKTEKPELSAAIANYIIDEMDGIRTRIFKKNQMIAFHAIEKEYNEKKMVVDTLKLKMAKLREIDHSDLIAIVNPQGLVQTSGSSGKTGSSTEFERTLNQYLFEQSMLNDVGGRYEKAKNNSQRPITQTYVVDRAKPSYKKVYPSYFINLAIAGLASLFFSISFLLFFEKLRTLRQPDKRS